MFNAKLEDGTVISMADRWHIHELKELRDKRTFYCPACKSEVQLKLGESRLWHFAHQANAACDKLLENETLYHLLGKKQLYEWLKSMKIEVAMEMYLPIIRQRPDILFRYNQSIYALEFQCSPISTALIEERSKGYLQLGMVPIWILGGNRLKRKGPHFFQIAAFEWFATRMTDQQQHLLTYYCPEQSRFGILQQITPSSPTKILASYKEKPIKTTSLQTILTPTNEVNSTIFHKWLIIKKHWRYYHPTPYPSRTEKVIQRILYKHRIPPSLFPIEAGWPSKYYYLIATSPCYWQTFLLLECLSHQPLNQPFSLRIVTQCLQQSIEKGLFLPRHVAGNENWTYSVKGYLEMLVKTGYLEKVQAKHELFRRIRERVSPTTVEEAVSLDQSLFKRLTGDFMNETNLGQNKGISIERTNI
ncbi:competence protein CoiA [Halalkalibacter kiskunsagensis]|uniref:Competence protein CoiA n=1 Tax=Halalkalibacter kiskunsagensis TaxID=1548599 RepID=A0ABV6K8B4_9BACI